jgi:hypothetical protein
LVLAPAVAAALALLLAVAVVWGQSLMTTLSWAVPWHLTSTWLLALALALLLTSAAAVLLLLATAWALEAEVAVELPVASASEVDTASALPPGAAVALATEVDTAVALSEALPWAVLMAVPWPLEVATALATTVACRRRAPGACRGRVVEQQPGEQQGDTQPAAEVSSKPGRVTACVHAAADGTIAAVAALPTGADAACKKTDYISCKQAQQSLQSLFTNKTQPHHLTHALLHPCLLTSTWSLGSSSLTSLTGVPSGWMNTQLAPFW